MATNILFKLGNTSIARQTDVAEQSASIIASHMLTLLCRKNKKAKPSPEKFYSHGIPIKALPALAAMNFAKFQGGEVVVSPTAMNFARSYEIMKILGRGVVGVTPAAAARPSLAPRRVALLRRGRRLPLPARARSHEIMKILG